ncbi:hypothetical protein [Eleftheria terrae]|uniref:hypothetical protein n=1 Tax=Eleftheria terrae TaxID=1597781 RepID=UPI00263A3EA1|nr:hypothetical protein [Eleftheria terrae]WKB51757.1 hypothetical protein N7L95_18415 [Eleftheria terrae]
MPEPSAAPVRFAYKHLSLEWNGEAGAWTCPLRELGAAATLRLFAPISGQPPAVLACEVALATLVLLDRIDLDARRHLESEAAFHVAETYRCGLSINDFVPESLDLGTDISLDRFTLTYRARFDPHSVWKVRFRGLTPLHWRVERAEAAAHRGGAAGGLEVRLRDLTTRPGRLLKRCLGGMPPYRSRLRLR